MPLGHHVSEVRKRSVGSNTLLREHGPSTCTADGCVCARRPRKGTPPTVWRANENSLMLLRTHVLHT